MKKRIPWHLLCVLKVLKRSVENTTKWPASMYPPHTYTLESPIKCVSMILVFQWRARIYTHGTVHTHMHTKSSKQSNNNQKFHINGCRFHILFSAAAHKCVYLFFVVLHYETTVPFRRRFSIVCFFFLSLSLSHSLSLTHSNSFPP